MSCLDTNTILDLAGRAGQLVQDRAEACIHRLLQDGQTLCTTQFSVAELWVGVYRSRKPEQEEAKLWPFLESLVILEFDADCAQTFGSITAELLSRGRPLGTMDTLIAAVALENDQPVVTRNTRHFEQITGLTVITY